MATILDVPLKKTPRGESSLVVYEALHHEILSLVLRPGSTLDETSLARRFNLSRSPIREALNRLQSERLVVMLSNRSPIVAPINLLDFPKFIEALDLAQRFNTRLAARHRTEVDLFQLRKHSDKFDESVKEFDALEMSTQNSKFHLAIAEAGQNPYTTRHYADLLNEGRRLLHVHFEYLKRAGRRFPWNEQHGDLVTAIADRDVEAADRLAHDHTVSFQRRFLEAMDHNLDKDFVIDVSQASKSAAP